MCGGSTSKAEEKLYIGSDEPGRFDILCGRDKRCFNHEGNNRFRSLIICHLQHYKVARSKIERSNVVKVIAEHLKINGSRLLKFDQEANRWYMLSERDVSDKISHALRDKYPPKVLGDQPSWDLFSCIKRDTFFNSQWTSAPRVSHSPTSQQSRKLLPFSSSFLCSTSDIRFSESAQKPVSSQGAESQPQPLYGTLSLQNAILHNHFILDHDDNAMQKEKPVVNTGSSALCRNHSSSFLQDLWAVVEPEQDEEKDDEFMDAINTLDFSDLGDHCVELMNLLDCASKV
jgi:hypothetical protein